MVVMKNCLDSSAKCRTAPAKMRQKGIIVLFLIKIKAMNDKKYYILLLLS